MKRIENNKDLARIVFASVTRPINAALAGAGALFAVAGMHNPVLAVLGIGMLAGTAGSVGRDMTSKEFLNEVLTDGKEMKALPDVPESLSGQYRLQCFEAKRHLDRANDIIAGASPEIAEDLRTVRDRVAEFVEAIYRFAEKAHQIDGQLTVNSRNEIIRDIEKVSAQMVLTTDTITRQYHEATKRQKEEQLAEYDELALRVRRIQAQMQHMNAALDNLQFKLMKISTAELKTGVSQVDDVNQTLQALLREVSLFEQSLDRAHHDDHRLTPISSLEAFDARMEERRQLPAAPTSEGVVQNGETHPGL